VAEPVILCLSRSGEPTAHRIAAALNAPVHGREGRVDKADAFFANALDHARDLFAAGVPVVGVCAAGILIRAVAPLLNDKRAEPPVVAVSDDGASVVPLLGGHRGANRLAKRLAEALGGAAAVTTAGDVALGIALDEPPAGWRLDNPDDAKEFMARMLSGEGMRRTGDYMGAAWLDTLPVENTADLEARTTAKPATGSSTELVYHPQIHTLGVGCARHCDPAELIELVENMAAAGPDSVLVVEKQKTANATAAIARTAEPMTGLNGRKRGRVSLVGIGPGQAAWRTPEASRLIVEAEELIGYGLYIDLLGPLAAGKPRHDYPLGGEEARCRFALERAGEGRDVALICSGDAGIYAMGALVFELLDKGGLSDAASRVEVVSAPGVSALQAAAARAGAPLGHDFCAISLSDLLTPRDDILRRIKAAAEGDFVIAFYNPVSKTRRTLLAEAREILLAHRPADTPVLLASSLGRPEEKLVYRDLSALEVDEVDMLTVVLIGSSQSRVTAGGRMYTPRGYAKKMGDGS